MKEILVTGSSGLVGSRFVELSNHQLLTPRQEELNIANLDSVKEYLDQYKPNLIINFAAYTNVTEAENQTGDESSISWQINVKGVENLLESGIPLIQISTDMVFSGAEDDPGPYSESHPVESTPSHLTWYGWTKNQAEKRVTEAGQTVVRIIYPVRSHFDVKKDYLRQPLWLFSQGKLYPMFNDQQVSFTFIDELVEVLEKLIEDPKQGIFHVSSNTFTPHELISFAVEKLGGDASSIQPNAIKPYLEKQANKYRYPVRGGLDAKETQEKLGINFRTWQEVVEELIKQGLTL